MSAQHVAGVGELVEGEARELCDHVVKRRLGSRRAARYGDVLEFHTHRDLGGDAGDGVTARLGSKRGRTGNAGVDLDQEVFARIGVQGKLNVATALDLEFPNDLDRAVLQHFEVVLVEGHNGRYDDGIARVDAHRIDVFHAADRDGVIGGVAHNFKLDLLVPLDALFHQDLMDGRKRKAVCRDLAEFRFIVCKAAARATKGERRTKHDGVPDALCRGGSRFHVVSDLGGDDGLADAFAHLFKELAVFRPLDAGAAGAEEFHAALFQHPFLFKLGGDVEAGLSADAGDDGVRTLVTEDLGDVLQGQRLHIHLIRDLRVRHDGSGVGVDQNHLVAFFLQGKAGLGAGVVEFRRLPDDDGARADDQYLFNVRSLCHNSLLKTKSFLIFLLINNVSVAYGQMVDAKELLALKGGRPAF